MLQGPNVLAPPLGPGLTLRARIRLRLLALIGWINAQFSGAVKSFIVLAMFGYFPGAWLIGIPTLTIYITTRLLIIRRRDPARFAVMFEPYLQRLQLLRNNFSQYSVQYAVEYISNNPFRVAKIAVAFLIFVSWSMPFSFFAIYGLYSYTNQEWMDGFRRRANNMYDATLGLIVGANQGLSFWVKLAMFSATCVIFGLLAYALGTLPLLIDSAGIMLEFCVTAIGITACLRDVGYALRNPATVLTTHPGKLYGMAWGRWLAIVLFPGKVAGTMGPAVGHVEAAGLLPSVFGTLFPASQYQGWFVFGTGLGGLLFTRITAFIHNFVSSLYFRYDMHLQGDFEGRLGPTSFQFFVLLSLGYFLGTVFEYLANECYQTAVADAHVVARRLFRREAPIPHLAPDPVPVPAPAAPAPALIEIVDEPDLDDIVGGPAPVFVPGFDGAHAPVPLAPAPLGEHGEGLVPAPI